MKDHCRVNLNDMQLVCGNCGVIERFQSGLVGEFENQLSTFRGAHAACPRPTFKPGDRVSFCGDEAVVVENHGTSGIVEVGTGRIKERMTWYWEFQGEPVIPVRTESV
jgi:hypothetical protein